MSKIALSGNASGTGTLTIAAPNTNSDRTVNLPDAGGDIVLTTATQTLTNKTFSGAQVFGTASLAEPTGTAPLYMCRAWVNFNGTGTVAIRASGNVSSITDGGTGLYTVNFTTALEDVNYAVSGISDADNNDAYVISRSTSTVSSCIVGINRIQSHSRADASQVNVAIFR
jgi:hypothetical protein